MTVWMCVVWKVIKYAQCYSDACKPRCKQASSSSLKKCSFWCRVDGKKTSGVDGVDRKKPCGQRSEKRKRRNEQRLQGQKRRLCVDRRKLRSPPLSMKKVDLIGLGHKDGLKHFPQTVCCPSSGRMISMRCL